MAEGGGPKKKKAKAPKPSAADSEPTGAAAEPAKKKKRKREEGAEGDAGGQAAQGAQRHASRKWRKAELQAQEEWRRKDLERRNSTKYHYLKFIERQKVGRKLEVCKKKILKAVNAGDEASEAALKLEMRRHLANNEYIDHYPRHLPYNALFPKEDSEQSRGRRAEIRAMIREALGSKATVVDDEEMDQPSAAKEREATPAKEKVAPAKPSAGGEGQKLSRNERRRRAKAGLAPAPEAPPKREPGDLPKGKRKRVRRRGGEDAEAAEEEPHRKSKKSRGADAVPNLDEKPARKAKRKDKVSGKSAPGSGKATVPDGDDEG